MGEHSDSRAGCQCGTMVKFTNRSPNPQLFVRCALLVTEYISQIRSTSKGGAYARNSGMHRASLCPPRPPQVAMMVCGGGVPIYGVYSREMEVTRNSWPSTLRLGGNGGVFAFRHLFRVARRTFISEIYSVSRPVSGHIDAVAHANGAGTRCDHGHPAELHITLQVLDEPNLLPERESEFVDGAACDVDAVDRSEPISNHSSRHPPLITPQ